MPLFIPDGEGGYERISSYVRTYGLADLMKLLNASRKEVLDYVISGELRCRVVGNVRQGNITATQDQVDDFLRKRGKKEAEQ